MSSDQETTIAPDPSTWPVLTPNERRVLGVLVEKAKTTPDAYPMSLNALVTGSNQKSNREPVMNLSDLDVEESLASALKKGLTIRVIGGRVERWRHALYEAWKVGKVELAILAELLLRGPQTEGELRGRASRMEPIEDLDTLRNILKPLTERRLVVYLTPEGRRGTVLTHGFHSPQELEKLRSHAGTMIQDEPPPARVATATSSPGEIPDLLERVASIERTVSDLAEQVRKIKEGFGM
jgi:uncharacterized protein YceH (UPF0502 family)